MLGSQIDVQMLATDTHTFHILKSTCKGHSIGIVIFFPPHTDVDFIPDKSACSTSANTCQLECVSASVGVQYVYVCDGQTGGSLYIAGN